MPCKLLITNADRPVPQGPGRWLAGQISSIREVTQQLGSGEEVSGGSFFHFIVSDKTVAEMTQYIDPYNRAIDMNVIAGPDPQGFRRINVRNNNCNVSGTVGAWTVEAADAIILEWNERYPTTNLTTVDFPQPNTWTCDGTFTTGQAIEFEEVVIDKGLSKMDARRIWYITPAGMQNISNAGGSQTGTAQQLGQILQDARQT